MKYRLISSIKRLKRASRKLDKARKEREWIESNPHINILNYPFYKIVRELKLLRERFKSRRHSQQISKPAPKKSLCKSWLFEYLNVLIAPGLFRLEHAQLQTNK